MKNNIIEQLVETLDALAIIPSLYVFRSRQLELFDNKARKHRDDLNFKVLHMLQEDHEYEFRLFYYALIIYNERALPIDKINCNLIDLSSYERFLNCVPASPEDVVKRASHQYIIKVRNENEIFKDVVKLFEEIKPKEYGK